jgi:hypothetical protein
MFRIPGFFKKYHKWLGLFCSVFIIMSALSGIVLNHRRIFSGIDLPRSLLPASYHYKNWNNDAVKGSFKLSPDSILLYGGAGIWLTDSLHTRFADFNAELLSGADNRITNKIMRASNGDVFAITTFDLYRLNPHGGWENISAQAGISERLSDLAAHGDTLVVLGRSQAYISTSPFKTFQAMDLLQPDNYSPEATLFRTLWLLHSGELFGLPGKIINGALGLCLIVLCLTGAIYTFCPGIIKRRKKRSLSAQQTIKAMRSSLRWHNKVGSTLIVLLVGLVISGMFLRPPLMIAIIRSKVKAIPASVLSSDNPWHDKLRRLRYDGERREWLLYASSGFYSLAGLNAVPRSIDRRPPVSVMGVTVLEPVSPTVWLVGSFSGLYYWNRESGQIIDCYKGEEVSELPSQGRPAFDNQISGYAGDFIGKPIIFKYDSGAETAEGKFAEMPAAIRSRRISLWHACLEIHVGRAYRPFIGPFSDLFVFLLGLFSAFILISGYAVYRKRHRKARLPHLPSGKP